MSVIFSVKYDTERPLYGKGLYLHSKIPSDLDRFINTATRVISKPMKTDRNIKHAPNGRAIDPSKQFFDHPV